MHFLCSTYGSSGDVFPMLGLAIELQRRGHRVTFATNGHFANVVAANGLKFEPLGDADHYRVCIGHPDLWHPRRSFQHVFAFIRPTLHEHYRLHAEAAAAGPVVGITNCFGFGALNAQEKLGVPVITLHLQPGVLWSDIDPPTLPGLFGPRCFKSMLYRFGEKYVIGPVVLPFLNGWRAELGLTPVRRITRWWNSHFGVLCQFPAWYAPPQTDWPANLMQTDFPLWNHRSNERMDVEVETFLSRGDPPIVFTPGSANTHGRSFFEAAVDACRRLNRRAILLTDYGEQIPRDLPTTMAHFRYVPLDHLLPRSAAFVHHGGMGSASQAMLAGIPQVVMPLAHDQFDNAHRVERLNLGTSISVSRFTGPTLARTLERLTASTEIADACRAGAKRLGGRDGIQRSADAIEERVRKT